LINEVAVQRDRATEIVVEEGEQFAQGEIWRGFCEACGRAVAAPAPLRWVVAEPRANRVEDDIPAGLAEMVVADDLRAPESLPKEVVFALVSQVRPPREAAVQFAHTLREP